MKVMYRIEKMTKDYGGTAQRETIALESDYDTCLIKERAIANKEELRVIECTMDEETFTYKEEKVYECDGAYLKMLVNDIKRYEEALDKARARKPRSENGKRNQEKEIEFWMNVYATAVGKYEIYKEKIEG